MNDNKLAATSISIVALLMGSPFISADALPDQQQLIKYFNPIHEKSYLNEKQDRVIKKKTFKGTEIAGVQPIVNKDIGLYATVSLDKLQDASYIEHWLTEEQVNGLSCLIPWRIVQPQEDKFDWQIIDSLLAACEKHHKQLILRISTCGLEQTGTAAEAHSDTPEWVFKAGTKSISYPGKDGKEHVMPIFWDGTYLAKWANFVNEMGKRYDKNTNIQSVGITGGGLLGGTNVVPEIAGDKDVIAEFSEKLKTTYGMNPRQLVGHWKYVADIFPRAFPKQRMNFDLDPPTPDRKGQDCLDEIADYLVYRFGERIYLTRQNLNDCKHGFDQYRLLLKYKNDTVLGYQINAPLFAESDKNDLSETLPKVSKNTFDDGISFAEIPAAFFDSENTAIKEWLTQMRLHLGYQLILTELTFPASLPVGQALHVQLTFINNGDSAPKRPMREMDKDVQTSYKIQLALKNAQGKIQVLSRHTPPTSTVDWLEGKLISWEQDLKLGTLKPGKYDLSLAIIDDQTNHKLNFITSLNGKTSLPGNDLPIGSVEIK